MTSSSFKVCNTKRIAYVSKASWYKLLLGISSGVSGDDDDVCPRVFQIHANCRIRRVYFSDRLYSEDELPAEFKLYLPVQNKAKVSFVMPAHVQKHMFISCINRECVLHSSDSRWDPSFPLCFICTRSCWMDFFLLFFKCCCGSVWLVSSAE